MSIVIKASDFISTMETLNLDGYIFRGEDNFIYPLMPKAFREPKIEEMKKNFGVDQSITDRWLNKSLSKEQLAWLNGNAGCNFDLLIRRLKEFGLYIMHYNHELHLFVEKHKGYVSEKDKKHLLLRDIEYWKSEATFDWFLTSYLPTIITRISQGKIIQKAQPFEDLAGVDETLPQHYGTPTAALDWSSNFKKATFFAIQDCKDNPQFCSLYALKILNPNLSPIKTVPRNELVNNRRAVSQEGLFTYFTNPCSFFLQFGKLPSINHFDELLKYTYGNPFILRKYLIERNVNNICYLRKILDEAGINADSLYLNTPLIND